MTICPYHIYSHCWASNLSLLTADLEEFFLLHCAASPGQRHGANVNAHSPLPWRPSFSNTCRLSRTEVLVHVSVSLQIGFPPLSITWISFHLYHLLQVFVTGYSQGLNLVWEYDWFWVILQLWPLCPFENPLASLTLQLFWQPKPSHKASHVICHPAYLLDQLHMLLCLGWHCRAKILMPAVLPLLIWALPAVDISKWPHSYSGCLSPWPLPICSLSCFLHFFDVWDQVALI